MSRRTLWYIVLTVVMLHVAAFLYVGRRTALKRASYMPPANNFSSRQIIHTDEHSGERTVTKEFNVSTRIVTPEELQAMQARAKRSNP